MASMVGYRTELTQSRCENLGWQRERGVCIFPAFLIGWNSAFRPTIACLCPHGTMGVVRLEPSVRSEFYVVGHGPVSDLLECVDN